MTIIWKRLCKSKQNQATLKSKAISPFLSLFETRSRSLNIDRHALFEKRKHNSFKKRTIPYLVITLYVTFLSLFIVNFAPTRVTRCPTDNNKLMPTVQKMPEQGENVALRAHKTTKDYLFIEKKLF